MVRSASTFLVRDSADADSPCGATHGPCGVLHQPLGCCNTPDDREEASVPNAPKYPARTIRVDDDLWLSASEAARERDESVSDVLRRALRRYVNRYQKEAGDDGQDDGSAATVRQGLHAGMPQASVRVPRRAATRPGRQTSPGHAERIQDG